MKVCNPSSGNRLRLTLLLGLVLIAATAAVLSPVIHFDFVAWDDDLHVTTNPRLQPVTWRHIVTFWREPYARLYIPLTYTVWGAVVGLSQALTPGALTAGLFHRLNLLLHLGSVLVVYRLGLLLLPRFAATRRRVAWAAAAGAVLFGLHPLQIEAVAWVSGLKDVLCGLWSLIAVWQYLEYVRTPAGWRCWGRYGMASMAFGLALLAKPMAVVVPVIAALLAVIGLGQKWQGSVRDLSGWMLGAALLGVLTKGQQPDTVLHYMAPWWGRLVVAADALSFYLGKLVWPLGLGPDYGRTPQMVIRSAWGYFTGLVPLALAWALWRAGRNWNGMRLAAAIFVAGLLPVLGLVPFLFQGHSTVADRYVYIAMLGPALGLGWLLQRSLHRRVVRVACLILIAIVAWRSTQQVQVWRNTITLFTQALRVNPQSAIAHAKLGTALAQQGRYDEAMAHYHEALRIRPNYVSARNNLGHVLLAQGRVDQALAHYRTALKFEPDRADVHLNLGLALAQQGKLDEAIQHYLTALHSPQHRVPAHTSLGRARAAQGQIERAIVHYRQALRLDPEAVEAHYNLGNALRRLGRIESAIVQYRAALRRRPDLAEVYNNLGAALDDLGRHREAIAHYQTAVRLKPDLVEAYNNLGDAWLDIGRVAEAIDQFSTVVRLRPDWAEAHYNLGIALTVQGRRRGAIAAYREALRLRPGWTAAALRLALAYRAAGQEAAALQTARRALATAAAAGNTSLIAEIQSRFPQAVQKDLRHAQP